MADPAPGDLLAGKYRLQRVLGRGGMGVVFAATHEEIKRRIAVKVLNADATDSAAAADRFRREAQAASKLTSEYAARVLDYGHLDDGKAFMVLERLDGEDLDAWLARGPAPITEIVDAALQAAAALAEAHARGLVHRDVKPSNLFRTKRADGSVCVKVLDFGISKELDADVGLTGTGRVMGTPAYMAPEQIRSSRSVDARCDIWSLGAVLYHVLTRRLPFGAAEVGGIFAAVLETEPKRVDAWKPEVPSRLADVVHACLSKDREARPSSMVELAALLAEFGSDEGKLAARRAQVTADGPAPGASVAPPPDPEVQVVAEVTRDEARSPAAPGADSLEAAETADALPLSAGALPVPQPSAPAGTMSALSSDRGGPAPRPPYRSGAALAIAVVVTAAWLLLRPDAGSTQSPAEQNAAASAQAATSAVAAVETVVPVASPGTSISPVVTASPSPPASTVPRRPDTSARAPAPVAPARPVSSGAVPAAQPATPSPAPKPSAPTLY